MENDCFAYNKEKNECECLKELKCEGCKFYKNDISMDFIEYSIRKYIKIGDNNE